MRVSRSAHKRPWNCRPRGRSAVILPRTLPPRWRPPPRPARSSTRSRSSTAMATCVTSTLRSGGRTCARRGSPRSRACWQAGSRNGRVPDLSSPQVHGPASAAPVQHRRPGLRDRPLPEAQRKFDEAISRYASHARKTSARPVRTKRRTAAHRKHSAQVRAWAKANGLAVSGRGRIPADIVSKYEATHAWLTLHQGLFPSSGSPVTREATARSVFDLLNVTFRDESSSWVTRGPRLNSCRLRIYGIAGRLAGRAGDSQLKV